MCFKQISLGTDFSSLAPRSYWEKWRSMHTVYVFQALYKSKVPNENLQESISESLGAVLYNFVSRPKQSQNKVCSLLWAKLLFRTDNIFPFY